MLRMRILIVWIVVLLSAPAARAADGAADTAADVAAIRAELHRQVDAWNRGDLDGYLAGYERAPTTTMVGSTLYRGWDAVAARYRDKYGDKARMGHVTFSELEVRPLGGGFALAIGRWALTRDTAAGGPAGGWFTLTLRKTHDGWRIVVDHTS
jgi:ketosteroid isomerase-like protein